jgi:DMSO reductase anchor subunit
VGFFFTILVLLFVEAAFLAVEAFCASTRNVCAAIGVITLTACATAYCIGIVVDVDIVATASSGAAVIVVVVSGSGIIVVVDEVVEVDVVVVGNTVVVVVVDVVVDVVEVVVVVTTPISLCIDSLAALKSTASAQTHNVTFLSRHDKPEPAPMPIPGY